jgi:DNA-binding response OmpR family regulator
MTSKILVVDDSITIQKIVAMAFEKEDAAVEGIGNGSDALVKLKKFKPDIVLADVNMPGLNGFELSKKIKESSEFDSVSVLLLTSDFEDFDEDQFRDSLADDHITKPFKSEDIVRRVMGLLNGTQGSNRVENIEDDEDVITLFSADCLEETDLMEEDESEESVVELGTSQLVDPPEEITLGDKEITLEEEEMQLELSDEDLRITLENPENEELVVEFEEEVPDPAPPEVVDSQEEVPDPAAPEEDFAVTAESPSAECEESVEAPSEKKVPEESLDELVKRVTELSKKSEAIRERSAAEEKQPLEALDEMIREVNALKMGSTSVSEEGNGNSQNALPPDTTEMNTGIAELNYFSEENAEELEAAFNEILRGNEHFSTPSTPHPVDDIAATDEGDDGHENDGIFSEPETFHEDLIISPVKLAPANSVETPEVEALPETSEVDTAPEATDVPVEVESVESFEDISAFQSSQEELFARLMGKEFREVLEQSLTASMDKEIAAISEKIMNSVEEAIKEIVPGIVQETIAKEIERHKNENGK